MKVECPRCGRPANARHAVFTNVSGELCWWAVEHEDEYTCIITCDYGTPHQIRRRPDKTQA